MYIFIFEAGEVKKSNSVADEDACKKVLKEYSRTFLKNYPGSLDFEGYSHPLPEGFVSCGGHMNLEGYNHPYLN